MVKRLVNKYKTNETLRHIFWITIVYLLAQGFLLVVTGTWWDDWGYVNKDWNHLLEVMLQSSLPLQAYIDASLWLLPDGAYRILVFINYYIGSLLVYTIMNKIDEFSSEDAFWITLLYITIPVNDVRITWICYGYSLGLTSFWFAFYLVTLWQGKTGKKAIIMRVLSLAVLAFSFNTESIMLMTLIILLYLYYERMKDGWKWHEVGENVKKGIISVLSYIDFLFAPIVFYFGKHMLFPGYGQYEGHNYVDWDALPELIQNLPKYAYETMNNLISGYKSVLSKRTVLIILIVIVLCYLLVSFIRLRKENAKSGTDTRYGRVFIMLFVSMFCFFSGFFPYVIRCRGSFVTTGVNGRHSLLLGIGTAMLFYYTTDLLFRKESRKIILVMLIVLGASHFNFMYLDWQEDYYQQLRFEAEIAENKDILNNDTFLCIDYDMRYARYYQFSGNSRAVTGEESKYYMDFSMLNSFPDLDGESWILKSNNIRDWDYSPDNRYIDGIIVFKNEPISNSEVIKLKLKEFFDKEAFNLWITETKDITFVPVTKEESDAIIEASQAGTLLRINLFDYIH